MNYVFYDTETTGIETAFDQILQFAAIVTDSEFAEVDRFDIRCKLQRHIVPSPGALRVTKIAPSTLTDPRLPSHFDAIRKIREKLLGWSPAIFIGYNSIAFDEELIRQALFQTLHPAYLTNTGGNARADIMRFVQAAAVYAPNDLKIPVNDRGRQTIRLDQLAPENGFIHHAAHEAVADVEATIHIARLLKSKSPKIWEQQLATHRKSDAIRLASSHEPFVITEYYYGREYTFVVAWCGTNPDYDAQVGVFDLAYDPKTYLSMTVEQLLETLEASPKVIRTVRANAQPILMPFTAAPGKIRTKYPEEGVIFERARRIRSDTAFQAHVGKALSARSNMREPPAHAEQRIYEGFPSKGDQLLMDRFQNSDWKERVKLASKIEDSRIREFARRLIFEESPQDLSEESRRRMADWLRGRLLTEDLSVPWNTIPRALKEVNSLLENNAGDDEALLTDVRNFLEHRADEISHA